ncbi:MAG: prepilin-type N-terminal cleavage/methylation domain-containing protein [Patescibacteria group bacterium]
MAYGHANTPVSSSSSRHGFTIVELLIVVVVIAILAAITIVAYNGIQNRAKQSAALAATEQGVKKIAVWQVDNPGQSPSYSVFSDLVGVVNMNKFQYTPGAGDTYCITATEGNYSYFASNTQSASLGSCPGHGANGVPAVTNLVKRPTPPGGDTTGWTGYNAAGGHTVAAVAGAWNGKYSYRYTSGAAGFSASSTIGFEYQGTGIAVPANAVIYPSIHVRSNKAGNYRLSISFYNGTTGVSGTAVISTVAVPANTWIRLTTDQEVTVPSPADRMTIRASYVSGTAWVGGDWIEVSGASTAQGAYGDGDSANWIWTGTAGYSTSTGPQL